MNGYTKRFDKTKYIFLTKDDELLEKYQKVWGKVNSSTKKELY